MLLGTHIGASTPSRTAPGGPPILTPPPAIVEQADLVLDSRNRVDLGTGTEVDQWLNRGRGGPAVSFVRAGASPLTLLFNDVDYSSNGEPSLEQVDGTLGRLTNADFTRLNYLHNGSGFTLMACVSVPEIAGTPRSILVGPTSTAQGLGVEFTFNAAGSDVLFRVFNGVDVIAVLNLTTVTWEVGEVIVVTIRFDGANDYQAFVDGAPVLSATPSGAHMPDNRAGTYEIGTDRAGADELQSTLTALYAWDFDIEDSEVEEVSQFLLDAFGGSLAIYKTAALILDARLEVDFDPDNSVVRWRNLGNAGPAFFQKGAPPFMEYFPSSGLMNFQPTIRQNNDDGFLGTADLNDLDYLHLGAPFTLVWAGSTITTGNAANRTILGCPAAGAGAGIHFYIDSSGLLHFEVFDDTGVSIVDLTFADAVGAHVFTIRFDGSEYFLYHDLDLQDQDASGFVHGVNAHEGDYGIGNLPSGGSAFDGRYGQLAAWAEDIGEAALFPLVARLVAIYLPTADLILDTRLGVFPVDIETGESATGWANLGNSNNAGDFGPSAFVAPIYTESYGPANDLPTLSFDINSGMSLQENDLSDLNYLHNGAQFTLIAVYRAGPSAGILQTIFSNLAADPISGDAGFMLRIRTNAAIQFVVANAAGQNVISSATSLSGDPTKIIVVKYDGTQYSLFVDGIPRNTSLPVAVHEPSDRTTNYVLGSDVEGAASLGGRIMFLSTHEFAIDDEQIIEISDLLRDTWK